MILKNDFPADQRQARRNIERGLLKGKVKMDFETAKMVFPGAEDEHNPDTPHPDNPD